MLRHDLRVVSVRHIFLIMVCAVLLFSSGSEIHAKEFLLHDPSEQPNIQMDCDATRYVRSSAHQFSLFRLHIDVYFSEKYGLLYEGNEQNSVQMALTSVASLPDQNADYLVLTTRSASAVINTSEKDVVIVNAGTEGGDAYSINGRNCWIKEVDR
jgi:hypothetical protein